MKCYRCGKVGCKRVCAASSRWHRLLRGLAGTLWRRPVASRQAAAMLHQPAHRCEEKTSEGPPKVWYIIMPCRVAAVNALWHNLMRCHRIRPYALTAQTRRPRERANAVGVRSVCLSVFLFVCLPVKSAKTRSLVRVAVVWHVHAKSRHEQSWAQSRCIARR